MVFGVPTLIPLLLLSERAAELNYMHEGGHAGMCTCWCNRVQNTKELSKLGNPLHARALRIVSGVGERFDRLDMRSFSAAFINRQKFPAKGVREIM